MKLIGNIVLQRKEICGLLSLAAMLGLAAGCTDSGPTAGNAPAGAVASGAKAAANAPAVQSAQTNVVFMETNSVFDNNLQTRRDPFYPSSHSGGAKPGTPQPAPRAETVLVLKSILGIGSRRCAGINDRTFSAGESATVRMPSGQLVRVHCLEIAEKTVVVTVEGESERKTLKLTQ